MYSREQEMSDHSPQQVSPQMMRFEQNKEKLVEWEGQVDLLPEMQIHLCLA